MPAERVFSSKTIIAHATFEFLIFGVDTLYMAGKVCPPHKRFFAIRLGTNVGLRSARVVCFSVGIVIPYARKVLSASLAVIVCLARLGESSLFTVRLSNRHVRK